MILYITVSCLVAVVLSRRVAPDAVTGDAVRQLSPEALKRIYAKNFDNFEGAEGFYQQFDGERCGGSELSITCPRNGTSHGAPICITANQLCDNSNDCPGSEDEEPKACLYHQLRKAFWNPLQKEIERLAETSRRLEALRRRLQLQKVRDPVVSD